MLNRLGEKTSPYFSLILPIKDEAFLNYDFGSLIFLFCSCFVEMPVLFNFLSPVGIDGLWR